MVLTHEDAFLADIVAHPDDDAPRLILADWLEDQGKPDRAAFIRLQCRLAALPAEDPSARELTHQQQVLLARHHAAWRSTLPELPGVTWGDFGRGFVESVFVESVDDFRKQAPALFQAAPIRRMQIGRIDAASALRLAASPHLARLIELNLGNNSGLDSLAVQHLCVSPHLGGLTSLLLHQNPLDEQAFAALAGSPHLAALRELYLSGTNADDRAVTLLAQGGNLPRLVELDLRDNRIGDLGAAGLAQNNRHEALSILYLVNNRIGFIGTAALAFSKHRPLLRRLYLNYNPIGDRGAIALAAANRRGGLHELDLRHCDIRDQGAIALAESPCLRDLELLWLGGNRISSEVIARLRQRFGDRLRL